MKVQRVWIEIMVLGTVIAFALALLIAVLGTVAGAAEEAAGPRYSTHGQTFMKTNHLVGGAFA